MPTASYLIADVQAKMGDPSGNLYTSGNIIQWLNEAQKRWCEEVLPLRICDATTIATGLSRFPLPSNYIMMESVHSRNSIGITMKALNFTDWNTQNGACPGAVGHDSDMWTQYENNLRAFPAYGVAATKTFLPGGCTAAATTLVAFSTVGFKQWGRLLLGNAGGAVEEVEYSGIDATHFYSVTRGLGNTGAVAHAKGNSITQCDLWMIYRRHPTALVNSTDIPEIRQSFHEQLELYVMYLGYYQTGEVEKAQAQYQLWRDAVNASRYIMQRETLSPMAVEDLGTMKSYSEFGAR